MGGRTGMIDRRGRDLPLDAHMHTDLSPDSDVPIAPFDPGTLRLTPVRRP